MAWIRDTLAQDNAIWLGRDPQLLEGKYRKMAADPFDFVRGTSALYGADLARPDVDRRPTSFLTDPDAASVLLAGDPHPENFGTMLPGAAPAGGTPGRSTAIRLELQDLDGASFGPWLADVRRGALGLAALTAQLDGCDAECTEAAVAAYGRAYGASLAANPTGAGGVECDEDGGSLVAALCRASLEDGPAQRLQAEVTTGTGVERAFMLDNMVDDTGKGLLEPTPTENAQLDRLLGAWARRPAGFRELDRARRFGVGVASFPAVRYVVLWDSGEAGPADDQLLSLREVVDPPAPPARGPTVPVLFDDNAARIEEVAWMLWSRPDVDPLMAGLSDGASTFKLTTWSAWDVGFDHQDIADSWRDATAGEADLLAFAATLGGVLAASHARGLTAEGERAGAVITDDLAGRGEILAEELVEDAAEDFATSTHDHALFVAALDTYGPRLGAGAIATDTPR